jgi:two-component system, NtrC family, response regulator AtoC
MAARVLVIEDDILYSGAIEMALGDEYSVMIHTEAPSIDDVASIAPDVILLDNSLPGISGCDFLKTLRTDNRTAAIAVIMMSGDHDILRKDPTLETACNGFLGKPFTLDELSDTVRKITS